MDLQSALIKSLDGQKSRSKRRLQVKEIEPPNRASFWLNRQNI